MDIKLLFNNLKKYNKKFKINKTDIKIKKVKRTNIFSGPFISDKIYDYINNNLKNMNIFVILIIKILE